MDFIISASTDVGKKKAVNQDALLVRCITARGASIVFAALCDGMGGFSQGEIASATVLHAFEKWSRESLPKLCEQDFSDATIKAQWFAIVDDMNTLICEYGMRKGIKIGTTLTTMLLTEARAYILNIGDTRAYEICDGIRQITRDHSLVAREVEQGRLTPEEAERSPKRNILTQCA